MCVNISTMKLINIFCIIVFLIEGLAAAEAVNVGVILDPNSRTGKEVDVAVEIAAERYKKDYELHFHFRNLTSDNPLQAAHAAEILIKDAKAKVIIIGTEAWHKSAIVASVGKKYKVPIISVSERVVTPPLGMTNLKFQSSVRWPFLVQMSSNGTDLVQCIAEIVSGYQWRRVIVIYEDDIYGGDSGMLELLTEALQKIGSEIEHRLVLPPYSSLTDPTDYVQQEMVNLQETQSRAFIVLRASAPMATHLFKQANELGLMLKDSAWILSNSLSDSLSSNTISSMEGALGLKSYYRKKSTLFNEFLMQFERKFKQKYFEEDKSEPGIYALRAHDAITLITNALNHTSKLTPQSILQANIKGLSGDLSFSNGGLSTPSMFRLVNWVGESYKELGIWRSKSGFSDVLGSEEISQVTWPGGLVGRIPKGWSMPTKAKPLKIGVPGRTSFEKFVKVTSKGYEGFCIDLFNEVVDILKNNYSINYEFIPYNGTYDDLVEHVANRTWDAIVGDVTVLADRLKFMWFTQPYAESGLTMIVPVRTKSKAWMFVKPFTTSMWLVTVAIMMYTMFIVWFLEHRSNPAFRGPWKNQLGTATWFTFSTLFFAHRERIHSNFTRVVVVIWLFVVLVLTSSYTASLTSLLTVPRLQPNLLSIETLKTSDSKVGCDGDSFVRKYLVDVLKFKRENIVNISSLDGYPAAFVNGSISAAFLELPYEKVFVGKYCKGYTVITPTYRFGGLSFVFQRGSPVARDVSLAILMLSENGKLKELEDLWLGPSKECSSDSKAETDSLSLQSFWGLYLISGATSTLCLSLFLLSLFNGYRRHEQQENSTPANHSVWKKTVQMAKYFHNGEIKMTTPGRFPTSDVPDDDGWSTSSSWRPVVETPEETPRHLDPPPRAEMSQLQLSSPENRIT